MSKAFTILEQTAKKSVVAFGKSLVARTQEQDRTLSDLVRSSDLVVFDLTDTRSAASDWIRYLARLSVEAKEMGREVKIKNMSSRIKMTADALAIADVLDHFEER